jgi:hypothetical protein
VFIVRFRCTKHQINSLLIILPVGYHERMNKLNRTLLLNWKKIVRNNNFATTYGIAVSMVKVMDCAEFLMAYITAKINIIGQLPSASFPLIIMAKVLEVDIVVKRRIPKLGEMIYDFVNAIKIKMPLAVCHCFVVLPTVFDITSLEACIYHDIRQRRSILQQNTGYFRCGRPVRQ